MNKPGLSFHFVWLALAVLMTAMAVVHSTATAARSGNTRIRLSNRRTNGELTKGAKSKIFVDYHTIVDVLKEGANWTAKIGGSTALADLRCSNCPDNCPPICWPIVTPPTNPPCPTCPPTYPTPPYTHPTPPYTHPTPPYTHPTPPYTHPTPPYTHPTPPYTHPTPPYTHPTPPYTHPTPPHTHPTPPYTHPTHPHTRPTPTHPPVTPPPCHDCPPTCPPITKPPPTKFPNLPSITFSTNCDFCDHDLYTLTCIESPFECASRCSVDMRCSHFTYIANKKGGTCILKKAFGSGGAWASAIQSPSAYVCGYIPSRALIGIFLNICVGLDITGTIRTGTA